MEKVTLILFDKFDEYEEVMGNYKGRFTLLRQTCASGRLLPGPGYLRSGEEVSEAR